MKTYTVVYTVELKETILKHNNMKQIILVRDGKGNTIKTLVYRLSDECEALWAAMKIAHKYKGKSVVCSKLIN